MRRTARRFPFPHFVQTLWKGPVANPYSIFREVAITSHAFPGDTEDTSETFQLLVLEGTSASVFDSDMPFATLGDKDYDGFQSAKEEADKRLESFGAEGFGEPTPADELEFQKLRKSSKPYRYAVSGMPHVHVLRLSKQAQPGQIWVWKEDVPLFDVRAGEAYEIISCQEGESPDEDNLDSDKVSRCSVELIGNVKTNKSILCSRRVAGVLE